MAVLRQKEPDPGAISYSPDRKKNDSVLSNYFVRRQSVVRWSSCRSKLPAPEFLGAQKVGMFVAFRCVTTQRAGNARLLQFTHRMFQDDSRRDTETVRITIATFSC